MTASKAVLVTGCSSGIGKATALRIARSRDRHGWTVWASARSKETLGELEAAGCRTIDLDVNDEGSMTRRCTPSKRSTAPSACSSTMPATRSQGRSKFLATSVKPDLTEPFFLAVLSASDGAAALEIVSAYKRILTPQVLEISSNDRAGEVVVTYEWPEADDDPP